MNISLFRSAKASSSPIGETTISDFLNKVKFGEWKTQITKIREESNKEKQSELKKDLNGITASGLFESRTANNLKEHSGFICMDFDKVPDLQMNIEKIKSDPYTYAVAKSASATGFFAIVKINPKKHLECFEWLASYYYSNYGLIVDQMPKSPASLRFASYDPDLFLNEKALKSRAQPKTREKAKSIPITLGGDDFGKMVNQVLEIGSDLTEDYKDWCNIGFALSNEFQESGREYFHSLSSMNVNYNPTITNKQYDECLKERGSGITIGTLYWMMQGCGVEFPKMEREPILFATKRAKEGATKNDIKEGLKELYGKTDSQAETILKTSKEINLSDLGETQGEVLDTLFEWLILNYDLKRNEITRKIISNGKLLTDELLRTICFEAKKAFSNKYVNSKAVEEIVFSSSIPIHNPIKEFFNEHKDRVTSGELQRMVDCVSAKDDMQKEIYIKLWLTGIIASAMEGHAMRTVLSFMSKQSTGKTHWFANLFPNELNEYSANSNLNKGKDDQLLMTEKLMIYKDENTGASQATTDGFKELVSSTEFDLRAPYGRMNQTYRRLAVVGLTSNWFDIMNDPTGNTRLLPVEVTAIDFEMQNSIDRTSLFIEMYREWESGAPYELDRDQVKHLSSLSEDYQDIDPAKELLEKYFSAPSEEEYESGSSWVCNMTLTDMRIHITNLTNERVDKKTFNLYVNEMFKDQDYKNRHTDHGSRKSYRVVKKQTSEELKWNS